MSGRRIGVYSPDPIERRDAVRRAIKRACAWGDVSEAQLGRSLGYSRQRFERLLTAGERASLAYADSFLAAEILGTDLGGTLATESAGPRAPGPSGAVDISVAAQALLLRVAELAAGVVKVTEAMTPATAAAIQRQVEIVRGTLGQLEAGVAGRVVERRGVR